MDNNDKFLAVEGIFANGVLYTENDVQALAYRQFKQENKYLEGYFNLKWSDTLKVWVIFQNIPANMYHLRQMYFDKTGKIGR